MPMSILDARMTTSGAELVPRPSPHAVRHASSYLVTVQHVSIAFL